MSTEQILAVSVEARINRLEREMRKAAGVVGKNFDQIERHSKRAADRMEGQWQGMAGKFAGIGKSFAAGLVGGFVAGGVMGILGRVGDVAKGIAEIGDEARRSGLGVEEFQELRYVAEQNRLGVDSLVDGIKELNLRADEFVTTGGGSAAEAFQRLGYNAETLSIKLRNPSALFSEIIGKLGHLDRAAQIRIADEIFGGTGGEKFVQLIEQGEDAINRTRQEAHDLGLVMDQELIDRADELDRKFGAVSATVGTALKTAIVDAATALSEFIAAFNGFMADWSGANDVGAGFGGNQPWSQLLTPEQMNAMRLRLQLGNKPGENLYDGFEFGADGNMVIAPPEPAFTPPAITVTNPGTGGSGGGRGASSMREQRDAAAELLDELQSELAMLSMSDVEQRVNAELRRAGAGATDAQKSSIRSLVAEIETERAAMERLEQATDNAKGIAKDFLGGLLSDLRNGVDGATALANAFGRLGDKLLDIALDTVISSLFENMLSGAGGGFLGGLFGFSEGGVVEAATGGYIRGPGTGTSDSIPARLSNGEYVINAAQTAKHRDLLDAINGGKLAAFATGGLVGSAPVFRADNDNRTSANDNAPAISISAPITVTGSAGTPEQNADLAERMGKQLEATMRGVVASEIARQIRPGNTLNQRAR